MSDSITLQIRAKGYASSTNIDIVNGFLAIDAKKLGYNYFTFSGASGTSQILYNGVSKQQNVKEALKDGTGTFEIRYRPADGYVNGHNAQVNVTFTKS